MRSWTCTTGLASGGRGPGGEPAHAGRVSGGACHRQEAGSFSHLRTLGLLDGDAGRERDSVRARLVWSALLGAGAWFVGGPWLVGIAVVALVMDALVPMGRRTLVLGGAALVAASPVVYLLVNSGDRHRDAGLVTGAPAAHLLAMSGLLLVVMAHLPHRAMRTGTPAGASDRP